MPKQRARIRIVPNGSDRGALSPPYDYHDATHRSNLHRLARDHSGRTTATVQVVDPQGETVHREYRNGEAV